MEGGSENGGSEVGVDRGREECIDGGKERGVGIVGGRVGGMYR